MFQTKIRSGLDVQTKKQKCSLKNCPPLFGCVVAALFRSAVCLLVGRQKEATQPEGQSQIVVFQADFLSSTAVPRPAPRVKFLLTLGSEIGVVVDSIEIILLNSEKLKIRGFY